MIWRRDHKKARRSFTMLAWRSGNGLGSHDGNGRSSRSYWMRELKSELWLTYATFWLLRNGTTTEGSPTDADICSTARLGLANPPLFRPWLVSSTTTLPFSI